MTDKGDKEFNAKIHMLSVEYSGTAKGKRVTHFFSSEAEAREQFDLVEAKGKYTWICDRISSSGLEADADVWYAFDWSPKLKYAYPSTGRGNGYKSTDTKGLMKKLPQRYTPLDPSYVRPKLKGQ
ncbi:hypothetical protein [Pararhizobium sp.]|uniref:hypothetical protein n=1 Tax=Pararhizobium sp. TaxID=1977563 RepID=UPI002719B736|nr:hypothetical protein [Pararhizobium sp.]MDO9416728.1 hypothetical protein [Pararhizobium sp.]